MKKNEILHRIQYKLKSIGVLIINKNPYLWWISWKIIPFLWFLLPHEKTYYGFRYLARSSGGLFLDIGANNGLSALGFRRLIPNYEIISVEANEYHKKALELIKKRIRNFDYKITAAGASKSELTLYTALYKGLLLHTGSSLNLMYLKSSISNAYPKRVIESIKIVEHKVELIPLDDLLLQPDIIKLDVEGFEMEVLSGLHVTINKCRPAMLIEYTEAMRGSLSQYCLDVNYSIYYYNAQLDTFRLIDLKIDNFDNYAPPVNLFLLPNDKTYKLPISSL